MNSEKFDENFVNWLRDQNLSLRTINNYINAIKKINKDYGYDGCNYLDFINIVKQDKSFESLNNTYHNTFSCAMSKYLQFLNGKAIESQVGEKSINKIEYSDKIKVLQPNSKIENLSYTKPKEFRFFNEIYTINNWADYIVTLTRCLIRQNPNINIINFKFSQSQRVLWSSAGSEFIAPKQVMDNLFLETNYSGTAICKMSIELLKFYGINNDDFELKYIEKETRLSEIDWNEVSNNQLTKYSYCIPIKVDVFGVDNYVNSWLDAMYFICNALIDNGYKVDNGFSFIKNEPAEYDKDHYGTKLLNNNKYLQIPYVVSTILKYILVLLKCNSIGYNECHLFYKDKAEKKEVNIDKKRGFSHDSLSELEKEQLRNCFINHFKHGYKIGSIIDFKRLVNYYSSDFSNVIKISQEEVENLLLTTSVKIEDRLIDEENIIEKSIIDEIINYIDEKFNNNYFMLYYKDVYERFKEELISTNILNEQILKEYLSKKFANKYNFEKTYFQSNKNLIDLKSEIKKYLDTIYEPITVQQIRNLFIGVSEEKIKQILNLDNDFINVGKNTYLSIKQFKYNEQDLQKALNLVEELIQREQFALRDKVIDMLTKMCPLLVSDNLNFGDSGICKSLEILFNNDIKFRRYVFIKEGQEFAFSKLLYNTFTGNEEITIQQLQSVSDEMGIKLSKYYLVDILNEYIRIDKDKFIKKKLIEFDVLAIDELLTKFTSDLGYISFDEISNYSQFPNVGYNWNKFLLESYIQGYSAQFMVESDSNSVNKVIGFIVNKKIKTKNFDEFLEKVLIDSKIKFKNKEEILSYLFDIKLIGKRRYQNIDTIAQRINV